MHGSPRRAPYVDRDPFAIQAVMYGEPYIPIPIGPNGGPRGHAESRFPMKGRLRYQGGPISAVAVLGEVYSQHRHRPNRRRCTALGHSPSTALTTEPLHQRASFEGTLE